MGVTVEICVETLDSALAAQEGGARRIELCANLAADGVTPTEGLLATCLARLTIPIFVMVRCRTGDFVFSRAEVELMLREVRAARNLGAHGVVIGALRPHGTVDRDATAALCQAARPLPVTFHRAFDHVADATVALETLIELGVDRVLTSGGAPSATEGLDRLAALARQAAGRIAIMPAGHVRAHNVRSIVNRTGVHEVHARLTLATDVQALVETANAS